MILRTPLLLAVSFIAGLFWSLGANIHVAVAHFIAPPLIGVAVAAFWRALAWRRQSLLVAAFLALAELIRCVIYCLVADGWHYIATDMETQIWLAASFTLQVMVGLGAWAVARLFILRLGHQRPNR
jgi:hypothetical protein